jgi:hypothetical protein
MTKKEMNQIMEAINSINTSLAGIEKRVSALEKSSATSTTKTSSAKKSSAKTAAPASTKQTATTSTKSSKSKALADFEPKKDADGNYNYKSWKTCRRNFVSSKSGKDLTKEWIDYAEFCKIAAPFDKKYPYTKKADR